MDPVSSSASQHWYSQVQFSRSATVVDASRQDNADITSTSKDVSIPTDIVDIKRTTILIPTEETNDKATVDKIKTLAQSLSEKKTDIDFRIRDALNKVGYSAGFEDNLKMEIDSKGKILISGVKDRAMARQIERELNKDKSLAKDIKDFRMERSNFSHALKKATGYGLDDLAVRKISFDDPEHLAAAVNTANSEIEILRDSKKEEVAALGYSIPLFTSEDVINLQDIPLFQGEDELRDTVVSLMQPADVDFARENPGIVDPLYSLEKIGRQVLFNISNAFDCYNAKIREMWEGDEEEIQKRLLHLGDFKMNIDENGMPGVEGTFSKSIKSDNDGHDIIKDVLKTEFEGNGLLGLLGVESPLKTTMGRFLELHEDNFGDTDEFHHGLGYDIKGGMAISPYAYSPEAEAASTAEIAGSVAHYLEASGISNADQLEIEINDEGKIVLANPIENEALAEKVATLLDDLNRGLAKATGKEGEENFESDGSALGNAIAEITPHLKHVMSHRPGGGHLSVALPEDEATAEETKGAEKKELFDKKLSIMRGTVSGTRSSSKPGIVRSLERFA